MRLSRTDLIPVLAIIAGGALGALPSASLVLSSRSDHVPGGGVSATLAASPIAAQGATIHQPDGLTIEGIAIAVRKRDGTKAPALFRGPRALASLASEGTFEFDEGSLPIRVRLVGLGEEMRPTR